MTTQKLLTEGQAADTLSVAAATLRRWRWAGRGPRYVKIGAAVRYDPHELTDYINGARRQWTREVQR